MVTNRFIQTEDMPLLAESIARDEHHKDTTPPEFFTQHGTVCTVYEDEQSPICFVRGTKSLRLDIQYVDNNDTKRNLTAMLEFGRLEELARENGFSEVVFTTNSPLLKKFCIRRFGFVETEGELRKLI